MHAKMQEKDLNAVCNAKKACKLVKVENMDLCTISEKLLGFLTMQCGLKCN